MLGFVKHRLPEHILGVITQCQRNPHCIYATVSPSKSSDNLNLESVLCRALPRLPGDVLSSLEVCRCLQSESTELCLVRDDNSTDSKSWLPSTFCISLPSSREGKFTAGHAHIRSCRVCIHEDPVRRRNNCDVAYFLTHSGFHEAPVAGRDAKAVVRLLFEENSLVKNGWSGHMQPLGGLGRNSSGSLNFADRRQQMLYHENVGVVLLCQFFDRNALRYGELATRQTFFNRGGPVSNEKPEVPSMENNLPSADQLRVVQDYLPDNMPRLFLSNHDYQVYIEDVIFENSWYSGDCYTTVGRLMYMVEVAKLRLFVHVRLANVRVQLLKTTSHPEDGTVRARWRVSGIPQSRAIMFWNFLPWNKKRHSIAIEPEWLDGFSVFTVNRQGLIYKHKMDRVVPDEDRDVKASVVEEKLDEITAPAAS